MRIAILYAPGDEVLAEQKRNEIGAYETLIAPLAATLVFGPHLALVVLWTAAARGHTDVIERLVDGHGVVVWRIDNTAVPQSIERVTLAAETSARGIVAALKLAEMERAPREVESSHRRDRPIVAVAAGVTAVLALGAAGAAAFMLDGEAPISLIATRDAPAAQRSEPLRPTFKP